MTTKPANGDSNFWIGPAPDANQAGLTQREAVRRLRRFGPNSVETGQARGWLNKILRRLAQPLVLILLVAAIMTGVTGDRASLLIIVSMVLISVALDLFQEHGAERAIAALRSSIAIKVTVLRDGKAIELPAEALVPGDVVDLKPGDLVPADGIVLSSRSGQVNEALLTGEPYPTPKRPGPSQAKDAAAAYDAAFAGTALVSGELRMVVVATGRATRLGGIAAALEADEPPTEFERSMRSLGFLIVRLTVFLVLFVLLAQIVLHRPALEAFLFAVALAVGLTPELLPMVSTVTLARGAMRMAGRKVIVRKLAAIHDLGAMDVLCTDKTGTLTEARIELAGWPDCDGSDNPRVLEWAAINSHWELDAGSPLDAAVLARAGDLAFTDTRLLADLPFDFERRCSSVLVERAGQRMLIVKGAPEFLLAQCASAERASGRIVPLGTALRARIAEMHEDRAAQGFRLLAIARRAMDPERQTIQRSDEQGLIFCGFCAFLDPPKASAAAAIARLRELKVRVKIISGDAAPAVRHLVKALQIDCHGLLTGDQVARLSDHALQARVTGTDLYARITPDQKTRIIRALAASGATVGFLGDGINDAPAIKAANAGISVEGASNVARAAADLILLAPDLGVLADGVLEGRRTYANIVKYVRMGTSSNFGNMLSMAVASLALPFLPMTAVQILLNNLLYDLSELGIPLDAVDQQDMASPRRWDMPGLVRFTLIMGGLSSAFDLATFGLLLFAFGARAGEFQTAWFVESMLTQVLVIFVIRTQGRCWTSRPHRVLAVTSLTALAAALLVALGPFGSLFGFVRLPWPLLAAIAGLAATYLACAEALKRLAMGPAGRAGSAGAARRNK
ncbi:MAG: magnesium-translocating P-type ATPase [Pseudomonadota bacterium]